MGKGVGLRTFVLVLDRPQPVYRPGEVVSGQCVIQLDGEMHLSQLQIKLLGLAECHWTQQENRSHREADGKTRSRSETVHFHSCHTCTDMLYCPGNVYPSVLTSGQHNIGFNFQLPIGGLPSSFEGQYGHIRYSVEAKINKTQLFSFDEHKTAPITITAPAFASIQELSQPVTNSNHKTVGFFGGQTVTLRCQLQRIGYNIGTAIPVNCQIDNQSKKSMTLKASLKQEVVFHAQGHTRKSENKLVRSVGNVLPPNSKHTEVLSLLVPVSAPVVHNSCPIIGMKYTICCTLDIPGSFDLHCELPVILTNEMLPFDQQ